MQPKGVRVKMLSVKFFFDGGKGEGKGVESGKWKVENGKWKTESGKWKVENGKWKVEN